MSRSIETALNTENTQPQPTAEALNDPNDPTQPADALIMAEQPEVSGEFRRILPVGMLNEARKPQAADNGSKPSENLPTSAQETAAAILVRRPVNPKVFTTKHDRIRQSRRQRKHSEAYLETRRLSDFGRQVAKGSRASYIEDSGMSEKSRRVYDAIARHFHKADHEAKHMQSKLQKIADGHPGRDSRMVKRALKTAQNDSARQADKEQKSVAKQARKDTLKAAKQINAAHTSPQIRPTYERTIEEIPSRNNQNTLVDISGWASTAPEKAARSAANILTDEQEIVVAETWHQMQSEIGRALEEAGANRDLVSAEVQRQIRDKYLTVFPEKFRPQVEAAFDDLDAVEAHEQHKRSKWEDHTSTDEPDAEDEAAVEPASLDYNALFNQADLEAFVTKARGLIDETINQDEASRGGSKLSPHDRGNIAAKVSAQEIAEYIHDKLGTDQVPADVEQSLKDKLIEIRHDQVNQERASQPQPEAEPAEAETQDQPVSAEQLWQNIEAEVEDMVESGRGLNPGEETKEAYKRIRKELRQAATADLSREEKDKLWQTFRRLDKDAYDARVKEREADAERRRKIDQEYRDRREKDRLDKEKRLADKTRFSSHDPILDS